MRFLHDPDPAYAPVRDCSYQTELAEVIVIARGIGLELMPWQKRVVAVATEYRLDSFGIRRYHYHDVVITVPRQSGKTTIVGPAMLHKLIMRSRTNVFFTAQTGQAAKSRITEFVSRATDPSLSIFAFTLKGKLEAGAEGMVNLGNNSFLRRFSPTKTALHGETPHLVVVDEFWAFTALEGEDLTGAISPGQITIRDQSQTWWISTMGTADSAFMNGMVEAGRAGLDPRMAYFEWSLGEGLDPEDPDNWEFHPALHNTITLQDLQDEFNKLRAADKMGEWLRAYMNRKTGSANPLISESQWVAMADPAEVKPETFAIAYEAAPGNALATVSASWRDSDGEPHVHVLRQAPGTAWLPHYVAACVDNLSPAVVAADDGGPTRRMTEQIRAKYPDLALETLSMPEFGSACMGFLEEARDVGKLHHDDSEALHSAVMSASLRAVNGVEKFSRDEAAQPIAALIASAVALWAFDNRKPPMGPQLFV